MDEEKNVFDKLSGKLRQPGDAGGKRVLNTLFFRSPVSRGEIKSIELPELPRGAACITGKDSPGKIRFGSVSMPLLSENNILWEGQPILTAAGPDMEELEDWMSRIKMDYVPTENPPEEEVMDRLIEKGSVSDGFSKAFQVVEEKIEIPQTPSSRAPHPVVCVKDGSSYTIHTASSWPGNIRRNVAGILKTEKKNIRIKAYPGGAEPNREIWCPAVNACRAALLSSRARRSVRIGNLPRDSRLYAPGLPGGDFHIRGAVDSDGRVSAMEIIFTIHAGAFFPLKEEFFERVVLGLFSIYPCRNYSIHGRILHHSRPPSTFGPAAGFELGFLAGELFASRVAEHSLRPPGDWHRESFPVTGQAFGPGIVRPKDFPMNDLLNRALNISDFERKNASYEQTRLNRENLRIQPESYRGIGLSCAWFGNGFLSSPRELGSASLSLTLDKEGDLSVELPSRNPGSPLEKAWADMAGGLLGLENKSISFTESPGRSLQEPGPSVLGRNVSIYTKLLELASNDLLRRRFRDALPISVSRSRRRSGSRSWNSQILEGSPFETISWGAGIVEVSMSTITMEVIPTRIWLIIDGGQILLPDNARASVEAAVENTLDWCRRPGESRELPLMDIQFVTGGNKRISRDVSTLPWLLIPPAFIQAVRQASGVAVNRIPVTPEQLRTGGMPE